MDVAVRARALSKSYNGVVAVNGIDFEVRSGECFGFLGPNGAGKTTTMKMIYGLATSSGGELTVLGHDAMRERRTVKSLLGVVPQEDNLDVDLSVTENLLVQAGYFGISRRKARKRVKELLEFIQLSGRNDARIDELSGGMRHRLLIARALVADPQALILDEPTTGLDPQARHAIWDELRSLKSKGITQILTTHYMEEAEQICDRLVIMDYGEIIARGSPTELIDRYSDGSSGSLEEVFLQLTGRRLRDGQ